MALLRVLRVGRPSSQMLAVIIEARKLIGLLLWGIAGCVEDEGWMWVWRG
jgi:hypothetical protein